MELFFRIVIVGFLVAIFFMRRYFFKDRPNPPVDYFSLFTLGVIWVGVGTVFLIQSSNPAFLVFGAALMIIGGINKSKWKSNRRTWRDLSVEEKKFKQGLLMLLSIFLVLSYIAYYLTN